MHPPLPSADPTDCSWVTQPAETFFRFLEIGVLFFSPQEDKRSLCSQGAPGSPWMGTAYSWRVSKRVRNYTVCMTIQCRIISVGGCSEKNMNCKLKLHSKGFYWQILGAVAALKFLHADACFRFSIYLSAIFPGKFLIYRQMYRNLNK